MLVDSERMVLKQHSHVAAGVETQITKRTSTVHYFWLGMFDAVPEWSMPMTAKW